MCFLSLCYHYSVFASFFSRKLSQQLTVQKQDCETRFHITRALIVHLLRAWLVTIVPVKLRGCRRRRIRVRRRNGRCRDVPTPKRWHPNGGAEMSCSDYTVGHQRSKSFV